MFEVSHSSGLQTERTGHVDVDLVKSRPPLEFLQLALAGAVGYLGFLTMLGAGGTSAMHLGRKLIFPMLGQ